MSGRIEGILTLLPEHFQHWGEFQKQQAQWGFDYFELREDLLDDSQLQFFLENLPAEKLLISFRRMTSAQILLPPLQQGIFSDCAIDDGVLQSPLLPLAQILSLHERRPAETLLAAIARLQSLATKSQHLKLAVIIENFNELQQALQWQAQDPQQRSVVPRSQDGRWAWVRLWLKGRQKINFIREGSGSAIDQPTVTQWRQTPFRPSYFAAVLGQPVHHSLSPAEHQEFFARWGWPFFAISLSPQEWAVGLPLLTDLGLRAAAVTSPLKLNAFASAQVKTALVEELQSVNTLCYQQGQWHAENTDFYGLKTALAATSAPAPCVLWGGGGTLPILKKQFPQAVAYSASAGLPREGQSACEHPGTLVWAAGPRDPTPPQAGLTQWRPQLVIDLNYRQDSLAREYSKQVGATYFPGLAMFKAQAKAQQLFWQAHLPQS